MSVEASPDEVVARVDGGHPVCETAMYGSSVPTASQMKKRLSTSSSTGIADPVTDSESVSKGAARSSVLRFLLDRHTPRGAT